jgi:4-diphosphocytidyl-2-C-methyl-D-erythritol kinase
MSRVLTLHPPAKINLTLRVATRRDDGYHDVRTLMQSIALMSPAVEQIHDTLTHGPGKPRQG